MRMIDLIKKVISLIMRFGPVFGGALGFAQKATDTSNNLKSVMPDFLVLEKALEFRLNSCQAKREAARAIFYGKRVIPVYKPLGAKLV